MVRSLSLYLCGYRKTWKNLVTAAHPFVIVDTVEAADALLFHIGPTDGAYTGEMMYTLGMHAKTKPCVLAYNHTNPPMYVVNDVELFVGTHALTDSVLYLKTLEGKLRCELEEVYQGTYYRV